MLSLPSSYFLPGAVLYEKIFFCVHRDFNSVIFLSACIAMYAVFAVDADATALKSKNMTWGNKSLVHTECYVVRRDRCWCACVHVCVHAYVCACMHTCVHACVRVCVCFPQDMLQPY